jgi:hypothetical protein
VAQPWTESAPVDFGKFAESAQDGASDAQHLLAATSKSFSDLLTNNIDKVNLAKNTLHATELLNSLNVDTSKQLFRSGDIMGSISEMIGTNNIDFKNENLTKALGEAQKRIQDNDKAILRDAFTTPGNEYLLGEDHNMIKARFDSTLSVSDILKERQAGIDKNTTRKLFDMSMDSRNLGKSPTMIRYQMLQENPGTINPDLLTDSVILATMTQGKDAQFGVGNEMFNGKIANIASGAPGQIISRDMLDKKLLMNDATGHSDNNSQDMARFKNALVDNLTRSGDKAKLNAYYTITDNYKKNLDTQKQEIINTINEFAPGADYLMEDIVDNTIKHGHLSLDEYAKTMPTKEANLFLSAYREFNGFGLTPAGFDAIIKSSDINLATYSNARDVIETLNNRTPVIALRNNQRGIADRVQDGVRQYKVIQGQYASQELDDLINAANGAYMPESFNRALSTNSQNTSGTPNNVAKAWEGKTSQLNGLDTALSTTEVNSAETRNSYTDFGLQQKYSSDPTVAYADNIATQLGSGAGGFGIGWLLGNLLPRKMQAFSKWPIAAFTGFAANRGFNYALDRNYGNKRYAFDDKRVISDLQAVKQKLINNTYTPEDIELVQKLAARAGSLSQKARNELNSVLSVSSTLKTALQ